MLEVPLDRPLADDLPELEAEANRELDEAMAIGDSYGVPWSDRLERARAAGPAIVAEADSPARRRSSSSARLGATSRAGALRSSARPSTTCSSTLPAGS